MPTAALIVRDHRVLPWASCGPADAVGAAVLHLADMGDGVLGPAVAGLQLDGAAAGRLGAGVVAGLLKTEGVHGQERVVVRHALRPGGQGPRDAVAQHARVAGQEVDQLAGLQSQEVARVVDGHVLKDAAGGPGPASEQRLGGGAVGLFAAVGGKPARVGQGGAADGLGRRVGADAGHVGLQQMGHDETGAVGQRPGQVLHRPAAIAVVGVERRLVGLRRCRAGAGQGMAVDVSCGHGSLIVLPPKLFKGGDGR